jgi:type VI secretion system protein ImpJ
MTDASSLGDALVILQLRALNEILSMLESLAFTPGIPPLTLYTELCRAVGMLSLFGETYRSPPLPRYDHDRLGETFYPLKRLLDDLLDRVVEPEFKDRPFLGAGLRMQVELEPAWVEANWQLYIGAQSRLPAEELTRLLTQPGALDMKVGSSERVDAIFRTGRAGLRFEPVTAPPRVLPNPAGLVYFRLAADAAGEWPEVQKSLSLAVRINENRIAGSVQGLRDITVQAGSEPTPLRFTLFAVPLRSIRAGERAGGNG